MAGNRHVRRGVALYRPFVDGRLPNVMKLTVEEAGPMARICARRA